MKANEDQYRVIRIKLNESYNTYIIQLVKHLQHLRNILIIIKENTKSKYVKNNILNYMICRPMILGLDHNEKANKLRKKILKEFGKLAEALLNDFKYLSNKLIVSVIRILNANYKSGYTKIEKGIIKLFNIRTKKISKVSEGTVEIDSNNVNYNFINNILKLTIYNRKHKKENEKDMCCTIYTNLKKTKLPIKQVKNCQLLFDGIYSWVLIIYKRETKIENNKNKKYMSIDIGSKNPLTCFIPGFRSVIFKYSSISKINRTMFNILLIIQSKIDKLKNKKKFGNNYKKQKKRKTFLYNKRNLIIDNELHKIVNRIIDLCKKLNIGNIIIGYNENFKIGANIGTNNNKNLLAFPHYKLKNIFEYRCFEEGIELILQEESYTSKLSCISDKIWKYKYGENIPTDSNGVRGIKIKGIKNNKIITSLFKDKKYNIIMHSDINGAINIMQKYLKEKIKNLTFFQLNNPLILKDDFMALNFIRRIC